MAEGWAGTPGVHLELQEHLSLLWRSSVLPKTQADRLQCLMQCLELCSRFL